MRRTGWSAASPTWTPASTTPPAGHRADAHGVRPGRAGAQPPARHRPAPRRARSPASARTPNRRTFEIAARVVINAAGVWADGCALDDPRPPAQLAPARAPIWCSTGAFLPGRRRAADPRTPDGRVLFVIPWQGQGAPRHHRPPPRPPHWSPPLAGRSTSSSTPPAATWPRPPAPTCAAPSPGCAR